MKFNLKYIFSLIVIFILSILTNSLYSQSNTEKGNLDNYSQTVGLLFLVFVVVMFIVIIIFSDEKFKYTGKKIGKSKVLARVTSALSRAVPLEKEKDIMFEHDFDGIKELDNKVPPWFNVLFYGTIIFAVIYLLVFHVFHLKPLMIEEYTEEVQAAQMKQEELIKSGALINENTVVLLKDVESVQNGKAVFMANCVPCHGQYGEGIVGPNLTDEYWIHGGGIKNIFRTIKMGVPEKGMITWGNLLSPKKIQEVASYVIGLQGTNPPNGKPPEGQKWVDSTQIINKMDTKTDTVSIKKEIKTVP